MPTLYWGPWLAKIRRGGPAAYMQITCNAHGFATVPHKFRGSNIPDKNSKLVL